MAAIDAARVLGKDGPRSWLAVAVAIGVAVGVAVAVGSSMFRGRGSYRCSGCYTGRIAVATWIGIYSRMAMAT